MYFSFDFQGDGDKALLKQVAEMKNEELSTTVRTFTNGLREDRQGLFMGDIFRSLLFIIVAAIAIWLSIKNKIKPIVTIAIIGVFAFIDIIMIDVNYFNTDAFHDKEDNDAMVSPSKVNLKIMEDKSDYRVFDLTQGGVNGAFNQGALTSFFHKSIGGYNPAKLSSYQDLIENQLYHYPDCQPVLDMLNTKYIIQPGSDSPIIRSTAAGPVWFVKIIKWVNGPRQEMDALTTFNPKDTAVIDESLKSSIDQNFHYDSSAKIEMVKNENDVVTYKSSSPKEQFAVFSEVYYKDGWNVYIDDKESKYTKVDYLLRGMNIPAGEHKIVFKFEPKSEALGKTLTSIASIITFLFLAIAIFMQWKNKKEATQ
jgi:hypothetical protein